MTTLTRGRRLLAATILPLLALALLAADPAAAFWKRKPRAPETTPARAANRGLYAPMTFARGVLRCDGPTGWRLGETPLALGPGSRVDGADGRLVQGREALVMGCLRGGCLVIHHATVLPQDRSLARGVTAGRDVAGLPRPASDAVPR